MQLGDLALGQGDDPDAVERELLEQRGYVLLVAAEPIESLRGRVVLPIAARVGGTRLIDNIEIEIASDAGTESAPAARNEAKP